MKKKISKSIEVTGINFSFTKKETPSPGNGVSTAQCLAKLFSCYLRLMLLGQSQTNRSCR